MVKAKITRLKIVAEWVIFNSILFIAFNLFLPAIVACNLSMVLTVAGFFSESNRDQIESMKRPVINVFVKDLV